MLSYMEFLERNGLEMTHFESVVTAQAQRKLCPKYSQRFDAGVISCHKSAIPVDKLHQG